MGLNCRFPSVVFAELYQFLGEDERTAAAVDARLEDLGVDRVTLGEYYEQHWSVHLPGGALGGTDGLWPDTLSDEHAALASWVMAPLAITGDSTSFGNRLQARVKSRVRDQGMQPPQLADLNVMIAAWVVGRVIGALGRSFPTVLAVPLENKDVWRAYEGLVEHVHALPPDGAWTEMDGSAIVWRFTALAEGIHPVEGANVATSIGYVLREVDSLCPTEIKTALNPASIEDLVGDRHALTHLHERNGKSFASVCEVAGESGRVSHLVRAAMYFVTAKLARELDSDEDVDRWRSVLDRCLVEIDWASAY